jgi:hypothetical protein
MQAFLLYGSNPKTTEQADKTSIFTIVCGVVFSISNACNYGYSLRLLN